MTEQFKRQTAYKFWIKDLISGELKIDERGMKYFHIKDKHVVRVNILGHIIQKYVNEEGTYAMAVMDDGSAQIKLKLWGEDTQTLNNADIGNSAIVIGRISEINDEIFIRPEIIRVMETPDWDLVRKLELTHMYGKPDNNKTQPNLPSENKPAENSIIPEEKIISEEPIKPSMKAREKVVNLIEKNTGDHGAEVSFIIQDSGLTEEEAELAIEELLKEGEAYEPKPGFIKLIE